jgi:phosphatidate cytidylyltransferase
MLPPETKWRIISGVLMAAAALGFSWAGPSPFAVLVLVTSIIMCWEWGRIVRGQTWDTAHLVHLITVAGGCLVTSLGSAALGLVVVLAGALAIVPIKLSERSQLSALGAFYVGVPAVCLLWLRSDVGLGFLAILLVFISVWTTDTFAYVFGRGIGGVKLWPSISPNKTWSGFTGGVAMAVVVGAIYAQAVPGGKAIWLAPLAGLLGACSQGGDLLESALKRQFGVKDSSGLIPGHGGVMDRLDGLVAAATLAALIALSINMQAPARAIMYGY